MKILQFKILIIFFVSITFLTISSVSATITVPTTTYLGLPTYGTYINFNTEQVFNTAYREGNYWYFNGYGFQPQNANMTITNFGFSSNILEFTLTRSSGTSTTNIYTYDKDPTSVTGATYSFDSVNDILTITATHTSSVNIVITFGGPTSITPVTYRLRIITKKGIELLSGITVKVSDETHTTDINGEVLFNLPKGIYTVEATYQDKTMSETITLESNTEIVFDFSKTVTPTDRFREFFSKYPLLLPVTLFLIIFSVFYTQKRRIKRIIR